MLLRLVAKYANVWNYNGSIDEFDETVEVLKGHCKEVGRDFDEIRVTAMAGGGICYDSPGELDAFFERIARQGFNRDRLLEFVSCKGSRAQCIEYLSRWKKKGCGGIVFYFNDIASVGRGESQAEIFKRDVFPHV